MARSDCELVTACLAGDTEAFSGLVERYRGAVYGLCYSRTRDFELARDLAQETFVSAYRALPRLRQPEKFAGWLKRIAENACKAARRGMAVREQPWAGEAILAPGGPDDELLHRLAVRAALESLPERCREVVSMHYLGAYTCGEIARFLSLPASTVKGRLRDGRAGLRKQLAGVVRQVLREQALPPDFGGRIMQLIQNVKLKEDGALPVVLLADGRGRALRIWVGEAEADALSLALSEAKTPRAMTYDLFLAALSAFGIRCERVAVVEAKDNTYFATVELAKGKQRKSIDARPSDAVNLAVRAKAPVFVSDAVAERMVERTQAEGSLRDRKPSWEYPERMVGRILESAVARGAKRISIRPSREMKQSFGIAFVVGSKREEAALLPAPAMDAVRKALAGMVGINVKPGAKRQTGRAVMLLGGRQRQLTVALMPRSVSITVAAVGSRRS